MGGLLHKLVENGNEITVAYMTSGNIAVFDHDVRRYVDFLERLARERGGAAPAVADRRAGSATFLAAKRPGEVDSPEVQDVKRIIREAEAVSGIETLGLGAGQRALPQPAVLPDRHRPEGGGRPGGRGDRAGPAARGPSLAWSSWPAT